MLLQMQKNMAASIVLEVSHVTLSMSPLKRVDTDYLVIWRKPEIVKSGCGELEIISPISLWEWQEIEWVSEGIYTLLTPPCEFSVPNSHVSEFWLPPHQDFTDPLYFEELSFNVINGSCRVSHGYYFILWKQNRSNVCRNLVFQEFIIFTLNKNCVPAFPSQNS